MVLSLDWVWSQSLVAKWLFITYLQHNASELDRSIEKLAQDRRNQWKGYFYA
jgi:hypothetical protein